MTSEALRPLIGQQTAHLANPRSWRFADPSVCGRPLLPDSAVRAAKAEISTWPGYRPTPLVSLSGLAEASGLGRISYKDEGGRFGLGSFKALGGAYAVCRLLVDLLKAEHDLDAVSSETLRAGVHRAITREITVASATDGNHGRSVAWGARQFGCRSVIYIHAEVSHTRETALLAQGAEVIRVAGTYDESVRRCAADAEENGWSIVSDTSWEGYRDIPRNVMAGYSVMVAEIIEQLHGQPPSHVFVQGGVGGVAATVADLFARTWADNRPRLIVVEPALAACLYASAASGRPTAIDIEAETLMAGLSCGEVSVLAWDILSGAADHFMTIGDTAVAPTMTLLAQPLPGDPPPGDPPPGDPPIVAGESAVAGLAAALIAALSPSLRETLELGRDSHVLVLGTEGATDPTIYARLTGRTPEEVVRAVP